jgi:hypothetical protein
MLKICQAMEIPTEYEFAGSKPETKNPIAPINAAPEQ